MMNRMIKNFKLLFDDIDSLTLSGVFEKLKGGGVNPVKEREEVLLLYRHLLKHVPEMHESLLEQKYAYEVIILFIKFIKFHFRQGSRETDRAVILKLKNIGYTVIEKINKGVYPPFPKYL
jgi:hypothetical protein